MRHPGGSLLGRDKPIDGPVRPVARIERRLDPLDSLERPVPSGQRHPERRWLFGSTFGQLAPSAIHRLNADLTSSGKASTGRHLQLVVGLVDRLDEQALLGMTGHDRRPTIAPLEQRLPRINLEPAARLLAAMTGQTFVDQNRPDLQLEEAVGRVVGPCRAQESQNRPRQE